MATRLRNYSTNKITKTTCFLLTVIFTTIAVTLLQNAVFQNQNLESLIYDNYLESDTYEHLFIDTANNLNYDILSNVKPDDDDDYFYYVKTMDDQEFSNVKNPSKDNFINSYPYYLLLEDDNITIVYDGEYQKFYNDQINSNVTTVYLAYSNQYIHEKQVEWNTLRGKMIAFVVIESLLILLSLSFIIYLVIVTGRIPADKELHSYSIDSIHTEIQLGLILGILIVWTFVATGTSISYRESFNENTLNSARIFFLVITAASTTIMMSLEGLLFLSFIRKWKQKNIIKSSYTYQICSKFYNYLKSLFDGSAFSKYPLTKALFYRQLVFIGTSILLVMLTFIFLMAQSTLFILTIFLELLILSWFLKGNNETYEKINEGIHESMEEQLRAERMKIDLVTNVSHDLKTPLTSIISYVDLLSKEEGLSDSAKDYIQILGEKSERLKKIVEDLFDIAKATSGNITLNFEVIDLKKLIEQTLADMEDSIIQANKKLVTTISTTPLLIYADGDKMYRVFQNVIDNALKYSLDNTRIFINTDCEHGSVTVTIMNTANYEMDFSEKEIVERFHRGDKSRSTDGSGLGLSIADSFTNACHGSLQVLIEGDIFKVIIQFKLMEGN